VADEWSEKREEVWLVVGHGTGLQWAGFEMGEEGLVGALEAEQSIGAGRYSYEGGMRSRGQPTGRRVRALRRER
jgi:hypothetical protein